MEGCYRSEVIEVRDPVLFPAFGTTYVITMDGSTRGFREQLERYPLTHETVVIHNAGFKSGCGKEPWVNRPDRDIWHANAWIMRQHQDPRPFFILEDDVIFTEEIVGMAPHIEQFVLSFTEPAVYNLGCIPLVASPWTTGDGRHRRVYMWVDAHAVIYTPGAASAFASAASKCMRDWSFHDRSMGLCSASTKLFMPSGEPCAVQPRSSTTNSATYYTFPVTSRLLGIRDDPIAYYRLGATMGLFGGLLTFALLVLMVVAVWLRRRRATVARVR
jgi:hypothetical protein